MELKKLAVMHVLGVLPADELPAAAADVLEAGYDSPSLRQLAGSDRADAERIRDLFNKSLNELGIPIPSPSEAGLALARCVAGDIIRGTIAPCEGAKYIWAKIYTRFPQLKELRIFVGLASEYEDDEKHRDTYSRQIVEESKKLLAEQSI